MVSPFEFMAAKLVDDQVDDANDAEPLLRTGASQHSTTSYIRDVPSGPSTK